MKGFSVVSIFLFCSLSYQPCLVKTEDDNDIELYREKVKSMFYHAYDGYLKFAFPFDELQPLTCTGVNTWGSYSLTLIDSLDTLAVMGNYTEFRRVAKVLIDRLTFDTDVNVSVFESNIRVVGGLITAHLYAKEAGMDVDEEWPCAGPLLTLAEKIAQKLLPAFDTPTGMPLGTVNLHRGVHADETPITCTAGVGTFIVEFGALSRLTGKSVYEEKAMRALRAIDRYKSHIGLVSDHIDTSNGKWMGSDSGIGAGIDSFFEYLFKGSILLGSPELMDMFEEYYRAIEKHVKHGDWYMWTNMHKGHITQPLQQSLECFWPGLQTLYGDVEAAHKTILNYYEVWHKHGGSPEFYNIQAGKPMSGREGYPLRPELIESTLYLHRATGDPLLMEFAKNLVDMIESRARTSCGYATIKNVIEGSLDNRMESFFLAETLKYLYLMFDPDNQLNKPRTRLHTFPSDGQTCVLGSGYIFNTEAHPVDHSALKCCGKRRGRHDDDDEASFAAELLTSHGNATRTSKAPLPSPPAQQRKQSCRAQPYYMKLMKLGQIFAAD